jgi:cellobiose-specific phosphotransferase system component IIC
MNELIYWLLFVFIVVYSFNSSIPFFTILFLFWTITHFARKIVQQGSELLNNTQIFTVMAAGVVGALAYTFSDSFWFSAVEGEVYALSSFFTLLCFG